MCEGTKIPLESILWDSQGKARETRDYSFLEKFAGSQGVYAFFDQKGVIQYIGQGKKTDRRDLRIRIRQELGFYDQVYKKGDTGATLCRNLSNPENNNRCHFNSKEDFNKHIKGWSVVGIRCDVDHAILDVVESFFIAVLGTKERLNRK